jgi:SAM-dependent methyltransferase
MGVAPDGSPVAIYLALSGAQEAELVASALPSNASTLELGCGTGRVTHELVARGFRVTAVDESAEMLEHVRGAEKVHARIEELDLARRFDCVLLASHFVNAPDADVFLDACARHVDGNGVVLVEAYPPDLEWSAGRVTRVGDVSIELADVDLEGERVRATMAYELDGSRWLQEFEAVLLDDDELYRALEGSGLAFERWLDRGRGWLMAKPLP